MSSEYLLQARGLNKTFGAVVAAQDIHISIRSGERVSLIGSNGAGKTTFVNMITGYIKPDSGEIQLAGVRTNEMSPRQITRLGVARSFQIPQIYPSLSVMENMLVAQACHEDRLSLWRPARTPASQERAEEVLKRFRLQDQRQRLVAELPGGMRKLLDIALALIGQPRLLLLDEPTSGVAAEEKFPMMDRKQFRHRHGVHCQGARQSHNDGTDGGAFDTAQAANDDNRKRNDNNPYRDARLHRNHRGGESAAQSGQKDTRCKRHHVDT